MYLNDSVPNVYGWLAAEEGTLMVVAFMKLYGVKEKWGAEDNPVILSWASEVGLKNYTHDSIAWCGLTMAVVAKRAKKVPPNNPLWALNWKYFGIASLQPMYGDVLVFTRPGGGHVGLYIAEDDEAFHVGGGNQGDECKIARIEKSRLVSARRPIYHKQPPEVRRIFVEPNGVLSTNEN